MGKSIVCNSVFGNKCGGAAAVTRKELTQEELSK